MLLVLKAAWILLCAAALAGAAGRRSLSAPDGPDADWVAPEREAKRLADDPVWRFTRGQTSSIRSPLGLAGLLDLALANSPTTREAWETARATEAQRGQARSKDYPLATASGALTRQDTTSDVAARGSDLLKYDPQLEITLLLLDAGGREATMDQYANLLLAANFQYSKTFQDLLLSVETACYGLDSARLSVESAEAGLKEAETALDAAESNLAAGLGTRADILQAKAALDNAAYRLEDARGRLKIAEASLAQAIGLPADAPLSVAPPQAEPLTEPDEREIGRVIDEAMSLHPDIAAARASLQAKAAALRAAGAALWPTPSAGGTASKDWYKPYTDGRRRLG